MSSQSPPAPSAPSTRPDSLTLFFFAVLVLLGGSNFVAVRFTVLELPPFWGAALRFGAAALLFWLVAAWQRDRVPRGADLRLVTLAGVMSIGLFYGLFYWALTHLPAGVGSVLAALTPLITFLLAVAHRMEAFRWRAVIGALVAVAGIVVAFFQLPDGTLQLLPLLAILVALVFQAESALILKRTVKVSPVMANALGLTVGAVMLAATSWIAGETRRLPALTETWIAVLYLIVFGSLVLFYLYILVIRRWTASGTSYAFVLFPFVTVTLGWLLAGEPLTTGLIAGAVLVLLGVWVGALAKERRIARPQQASEA
jgi:drug/metabolite transporter (DMT)-like permease